MTDSELCVDFEDEPDPTLNRWTNAVIGAAIEVHSRLGPGHLESAYCNAMAIEMKARGIPFAREVNVDLFYKGESVGKGRLDFLTGGSVIVEIKAVDALSPIHSAQVISYLKITGHRLALVINFNVRSLREGLKRIAH
jgi:GxxExxY protein